MAGADRRGSGQTMKIYISCPGQFYEGLGFNSKIRGEGRWLVHMSGVLAEQGHNVTIFSNDPVKPYKDRGVVFSSIFNLTSHDPCCDVLIAMDAFPDLPHVHKSGNVSPLLPKFRAGKRVWAAFFPLGGEQEEVYDIIPTIHPWNYQQCREGKGVCLPIIIYREVQPPGFHKKHIHWYSKNAHEEPKYILGVIQGLHKLVTCHGAVGSFVDGVQIESQKYRKEYPQPKEDQTKSLFREMIRLGSESFSGWATYDYVQGLMSKSKLLVGVHHPVVAPSMAEIAAYGGFPVIFGNQKDCPPYDRVDIPFIPEDISDEQVCEFILDVWTNEDLFVHGVETCQSAIVEHAYGEVYQRVEQFIKSL